MVYLLRSDLHFGPTVLQTIGDGKVRPHEDFESIGLAVKKSELYSSLWASCDELRGGMDASQHKDYVLVLLFILGLVWD